MTESNHLSSIIHSVRRRRWTVTVLQGVAITIAAAAALVVGFDIVVCRRCVMCHTSIVVVVVA